MCSIYGARCDHISAERRAIYLPTYASAATPLPQDANTDSTTTYSFLRVCILM